MSLSFNPEDLKKETVHAEKGLKIELINSLADTMRQYDEKSVSSINRQADMLTNDIANKLVSFIKTLKTDRVLVTSIGKNLQKNDETNAFDGSIDFTFNVLHAGATKTLNLKIPLKNSSFDMPSAKIITAELGKTISAEQVVEDTLKKEMNDRVEEITAGSEETIDKAAGLQTTTAPHTVIHVQKLWLPSSLKMGDTINLEGALYEIVSDDHNKMSASSDGTFWTLRAVSQTSDGKSSEVIVS